MYPNPQEALPLPPRPDLGQYRKLAKDLVKASRSSRENAFGAWATRWIAALGALYPESSSLGLEQREHRSRQAAEYAEKIAEFAAKTLSGQSAITHAQFVIARVHGFTSWKAFAEHIKEAHRASSTASAFEAGAQAVVSGDIEELRRLLDRHPDLIHARSTREHRATLLHYVSANGVESYRQISPANSAAIAELLLAKGAEVDAGANVYGSAHCTTLGLVATSAPPDKAGVQLDVIDVLLRHGARMDLGDLAGNAHAVIRACLANGQPRAAAHLVARGARLGFAEAAGLGRVDVMAGFLDDDGRLKSGTTRQQFLEGFALACIYGRTNAVEHMLERGVDVDVELHGHGEGHTGLHVAAFHAHAETVGALIRRGANVEAIDKTWQSAPLEWALTGWTRSSAPTSRYCEVVRLLVRAGATVSAEGLADDTIRADPEMFAALRGQ
jgi:ankyrin repeat protein